MGRMAHGALVLTPWHPRPHAALRSGASAVRGDN
eukprot:CAMPEP_0118819000 /NCGR_PEP_ID=MMETSP1162-20130426/6603_1 /TAXON_ID=33656 /ORGANISM="Phaeocystis Sp, Strain CCMP2710" /LENGTH=33 /DNA_ID= /DNA_START= /DNA_END= /DNA_ORIENTATION=